MTIRFRAAEADELVDDERAAQRIYMGSAMTMEPGEFIERLPDSHPPCSSLQPASHFCQWTPPALPQSSKPPSFSPNPSAFPSLPTPLPGLYPQQSLSLASNTCPAAMLETGLFVSTLAGLVRLY
jgi:hypothetical protein